MLTKFLNIMKTRIVSIVLFVTALSSNAFMGYSAGDTRKPNILLIISDDLNMEIGPYNNLSNHTPNLDRLAKEGIRFTRAYCQYPLCGPSRASFMTGLYPETNKVLSNRYEAGGYKAFNPALANHPSLAGFFRDRGYYTARVSKVFHMGIPGGIEQAHPGDDDPDSWDFVYNVQGPERQSHGIIDFFAPKVTKHDSYGAVSNIAVRDEDQFTQTDFLATSQAIAILESRAGSYNPDEKKMTKLKPAQPFFLAVGLIRPHTPFIAPENCFKPYPEEEMTIPKAIVGDNVPEQALRSSNKKWKMTEDGKKRFISGYLASVHFMDQQVGRLLDALEKLNFKENTIVVFISDHGFNLGEHDCWNKPSLWESTVRVPLIISYPGSKYPENTKCDAISELIDIYPTLVELSGYKSEQPKILQGKSLVDLMAGNEVEVSDQFMAYTAHTKGKEGTLRTNRYRYTRWGDNIGEGNEELYDYLNDPEEHNNLVADPAMRKTLNDLRARYDNKKASIRK
jgi:arylsulfatase A-like enzyme